MDFLYVILTGVFFALALGYVRACAALGLEESEQERATNAG